MQSNASQLEDDRNRRLVEIEARDENERLEDEKRRSKKGQFVSGLHRQVESDLDLGDRLKRSRSTLEKLEAY